VAKNKIPPNLTEDILERAGTGRSGAEIAAWLGQVHGIKVSGRAVLGLLRKIRDERQPIAKAVLTEQLGKTLTSDLRALDGILDRAAAIEREARDAGERDEALRAQDRQLRALELRLKLSGAGEPDEPERLVVVLPAQRPILPASESTIEANASRGEKST
jgi:hypothetical protein